MRRKKFLYYSEKKNNQRAFKGFVGLSAWKKTDFKTNDFKNYNYFSRFSKIIIIFEVCCNVAFDEDLGYDQQNQRNTYRIYRIEFIWNKNKVFAPIIRRDTSRITLGIFYVLVDEYYLKFFGNLIFFFFFNVRWNAVSHLPRMLHLLTNV